MKCGADLPVCRLDIHKISFMADEFAAKSVMNPSIR